MRAVKGQMSEAFATVAFLSVSGGLQDAYTYVSRGKVFANAQTGNIVLLAQGICEGRWDLVLHYLVPLLCFSLGIAAAEIIRENLRKAERIHWRQIVLLCEILLLLAVGFVPRSLDVLANAMVSFSCAMQVQAFRKVDGYAFASTMCIGNIRSCMDSLCAYCRTRDRRNLSKAARYFGVIFLFALGAAIGVTMYEWFGIRTIWASCVLLSAGFVLMFIKSEVEKKSV